MNNFKKSYMERIASELTYLRKAKKDDIDGYGPCQVRATGEGWFYRIQSHPRDIGFFGKEEGDLELAALQASIKHNRNTILDSLANSGYNAESTREKMKKKLLDKNLSNENTF